MVISVKWKTISLLGLLLVVLIIGLQLFYPVFVPPRSTHGRRLMTDESCRSLEEQVDYLQALLKSNEQKSLDTLERLRAQNAETRRQLDIQRGAVKDLERRNRQLIEKLSSLESGGPRRNEANERLAPRIDPTLVRTLNIQQSSEFEVLPYTGFTKDRVYQLELGMLNKPEVSAIGSQKEELSDVTDTALGILNHRHDGKSPKYTLYDLAQGYTRNKKTTGTQYELFFHTKGKKHSYEHVQLFRPFAPTQKVQVQSFDKTNEWINLIVPLSGRLDSMKTFLKMFVEVCIERDQRVFLTVVYFGEEGKVEAKTLLEDMATENHFTSYKFIERAENFSRGVGLMTGAEAWDQGNALLFFCDIDIAFDAAFLDRCRLNTAPGARVYYPIVFSLYNPSIVYSDRADVPDLREQLVMTRDSGFWRTFGFGMTCVYRSDFLFMRGFDTNIQGWGFEDVKLYRKFVQSNMDVVRAPDWGIFHIWHAKECDPHLPTAQYNMCLGSKAMGEASHHQLGMLAFRELKKENEALNVKYQNMETLPHEVYNDVVI